MRRLLSFDLTDRSVAQAKALANVAALAPDGLLEYRRSTFGQAQTTELIQRIRGTLAADKESRESFASFLYLDALPPSSEIKSAVSALRRKDGLFALIDGDCRRARKLHAGLSKDKRKLSGRQCADELARLAEWIEASDAFISNTEFKEYFGGLFRGLDTDPEKLVRLDDWYRSAKALLVECPGLVDMVDLTATPANTILELSAKADSVKTSVDRLAKAETVVRCIIGTEVTGLREAKANGWDSALNFLGETVEGLALVTGFFGVRADTSLSPVIALSLMEARAELDEAASDLALLMRGQKELREAGGEEFSYLASLATARWSETLPEVVAHVSLAAETALQALAFAGEQVPLSIAQEFATAKSELDAVWSKVAPIPKWNQFDAWPAVVGHAREDALAARAVLERISPFARNGTSAKDVFTAATEEAEAKSILDHFSGSEDVRQMLGLVFDGAATDLDRLSQTHEWGEAVCALELPASVCRRLLSEDARDALYIAKRLVGEIDDGCRQAREILESLASRGSFSWCEWQKQVQAGLKVDLPSEIAGRLENVVAAPRSILPWSKYHLLRKQARQRRLGSFTDALESGRMPSSVLASAFEFAVYQSIGRSIYQEFPELSRFNGAAHDKTRSDFSALDAEIISLTGKDFASQIEQFSSVPEGNSGTRVGDYTEFRLIRHQIGKGRHIPIRQLLKRAGRALQELKPCFMMGPHSVAQYLEQGALKFDLVVMDEASQLRPEEALGAIARGDQLVVVGDPKQLPPTSFFDRMLDAGDDEDEDEAPASINGMESILDICQQLFTPVRSLRWHYRSHHESLIAFSNHHFYKNLIVFPSPYAKSPGLGVKYRYVKGGSYKDRQNIPEAQRLVDAVLEHMIKHPDESLGVVTLNQTQRELIEELLDKKLKTFDEGADFLGRWEAEGWPFFVKNLENVQGDERDVIFISTTFGKAPGTDKLRQNFGPISRPDGWRRLNVLFTRSRRRIELFTSMAPEDIVTDERTPLGTKALRDYLDFAKRGVLVTTDEGEREPDSDFEVSVANVVTALGYEIKPQLGVAGFFIDMAVRNPDRPGEFLVGIECDGATYHSGSSVRDRDRIRQEILESLGWKGRIYRIWSTDWFYNPSRETERLRTFLEERRLQSAVEDTTKWETEDIFEEMVENETEGKSSVELADEVAVASDGSADLFVEVGDRVIYCLVDTPADRQSILIVESRTNMGEGLINEHETLARTLLGLSPGDVGELVEPDQKSVRLQVIKVQRQEEFQM